MTVSLDYQEAVHRLQSCVAMQKEGRERLLLGENGELAVPGINPNRITPKYLEPFIVELQRVTRQLEEIIAEYGEPGDNLLGEWYWSGVDDLKRLRARVTYYREALDYSRSLGATEQRAFLYENVFLPIFYGSRHKNVSDLTSPWIHTLSDYCEPGRIYKNYVYAVDVNDAHTGLGLFLSDMGDVVVDFFQAVGDVAERLHRGGKKIVEGVASFVKKGALPIGILLAGVGIFMLVRKKKGQGGG